MIQDGSKVTFHYTLTVDGEEIDSSRGGEPLAYIHGQNQIVPGLEEQMEGKNTGDKLSLEVPPEKAYGEPNPSAMQQVPKASFAGADTLNVGDLVQGMAGGKQINARVAVIEEDAIVIDLNHPLAGKTLNFDVEIVGVV